jgi:hypothetical protein
MQAHLALMQCTAAAAAPLPSRQGNTLPCNLQRHGARNVLNKTATLKVPASPCRAAYACLQMHAVVLPLVRLV